MPRKRHVFDGSFKAKVALEAIRGLNAVSELALAEAGIRQLTTVQRESLGTLWPNFAE